MDRLVEDSVRRWLANWQKAALSGSWRCELDLVGEIRTMSAHSRRAEGPCCRWEKPGFQHQRKPVGNWERGTLPSGP